MNLPIRSETVVRCSPVPPHVHFDGEACPACGQDIPADKLEEISGKIAVREREQTLAITSQLEGQHAVERAQADAKAKAELESARPAQRGSGSPGPRGSPKSRLDSDRRETGRS